MLPPTHADRQAAAKASKCGYCHDRGRLNSLTTDRKPAASSTWAVIAPRCFPVVLYLRLQMTDNSFTVDKEDYSCVFMSSWLPADEVKRMSLWVRRLRKKNVSTQEEDVKMGPKKQKNILLENVSAHNKTSADHLRHTFLKSSTYLIKDGIFRKWMRSLFLYWALKCWAQLTPDFFHLLESHSIHCIHLEFVLYINVVASRLYLTKYSRH